MMKKNDSADGSRGLRSGHLSLEKHHTVSEAEREPSREEYGRQAGTKVMARKGGQNESIRSEKFVTETGKERERQTTHHGRSP